jgi:hypothetical protein
MVASHETSRFGPARREAEDGTMAEASRVLGRQYVSFVVRLVVDADGNLVSGEVIRVPLTHGRHFRGWGELVEALRSELRKPVDRDPVGESG